VTIRSAPVEEPSVSDVAPKPLSPPPKSEVRLPKSIVPTSEKLEKKEKKVEKEVKGGIKKAEKKGKEYVKRAEVRVAIYWN
jgi:hypothetical protein